MLSKIIYLSPFRYSFRPPSSVFFSFFFSLVGFFFIYYFHYLWHQLSWFLTALITLLYYFLLQHTLYLISHLFLSSIIFSICMLIVGIFYCLNCILLLLHLIITHLVNIFYKNYVINICSRQLLWFI